MIPYRLRFVSGVLVGGATVVGALFIIGDRIAKAILEEAQDVHDRLPAG